MFAKTGRIVKARQFLSPRLGYLYSAYWLFKTEDLDIQMHDLKEQLR
jgi:hypothetical protein